MLEWPAACLYTINRTIVARRELGVAEASNSSTEIRARAFDAAPVALVVLAADGGVDHANAAAAALLSAHGVNADAASFNDLMASCPGIEAIFTTLGDDGAKVAVLHDIKRRRAATTNMVIARKMEALGELAGNIAHEFNNHLGGASGFAQMALAGIDDPARVKTCLDEVIAATDAGAKLTSRIMVFGRRQDREQEATTIAPHILDAEHLIAPMLESGITLSFDVAADEPGRVLIGPGELTEILLNLADNAARALRQRSDGEIKIRLARQVLTADRAAILAEASPGPYLALSVTDNGCGMTRDTLECMFDPFFTVGDVGESEGLGLALVYALVARADGRIEAASQPDAGTTVTIYFPLVE